MKKLIQFLTLKIKYIIIIYTAIQLTLIFTTDISYTSDSLYYYNLAQECIDQGEFYPLKQHLYEDYIFAPLYINVLVLLFQIYNSTTTICIFNLLLILLQIYLLYKISYRILSKNVALLTLLLYMFYLNTIALLLQNYTELFFLLLISLSIYFFLQNNKIKLFLAGIMLGGAIAVRPVGWALMITFAILQISNSLKSKKILLSYNYIYIGVLIFILFFGGFTFTHFGRFEFTSTNGPVNLLIGANDDATGGFKSTVFEKGKIGYIGNSDTLTYIQKGDYYKTKAIEWIEDHPLDWVFLMPLKLLHAFGWDDITLSTFLGFNELNFGRALRNLFDGNINSSTSVQKSVFSYFFYFLIQFLHHLFYYIILISILIGIYILIKHKVCNDGINVILLFSFNLIIIILIIFGSPRFKYPIFILLLPFAASYLDLKLGIGNNRIEK